MKGIAFKDKDNNWVIRYKYPDKLMSYEIPLSPYENTHHYQISAMLAEENEVEFEIETHWETGLEQPVEWAVLIKPETDVWDKILTHFYDNYDTTKGKDWDDFLKWLKDNYHEPVKKQQ